MLYHTRTICQQTLSYLIFFSHIITFIFMYLNIFTTLTVLVAYQITLVILKHTFEIDSNFCFQKT